MPEDWVQKIVVLTLVDVMVVDPWDLLTRPLRSLTVWAIVQTPCAPADAAMVSMLHIQRVLGVLGENAVAPVAPTATAMTAA